MICLPYFVFRDHETELNNVFFWFHIWEKISMASGYSLTHTLKFLGSKRFPWNPINYVHKLVVHSMLNDET